MNDIAEIKAQLSKNDKSNFRETIMDFEQSIKQTEGSFIGDSDYCPLKHSFSDGIYVREIFIPAGTILVGKIHKHEHPNFLMSGEVEVITELGGSEHLIAPLSMISKAGTKRVVKAITDTVWITIHHNPSNIQDLNKLEQNVIAENYEAYEKFKNKKISLVNRIINRFKNVLQ